MRHRYPRLAPEKRVAQIGGRAAAPPSPPGYYGSTDGRTGALFPESDRGFKSPIFGDFGERGIEAVHESGNEASLPAISAHTEGRPGWWRVGRVFLSLPGYYGQIGGS